MNPLTKTAFWLIYFLFAGMLLAQEPVEIDSILEAYFKEALQLPDSTLFLGEVTLKWCGNDGKYYTADSGIIISYQTNQRYITAEAGADGFFFFVLSREDGTLMHLGISYDTLVIPIQGLVQSVGSMYPKHTFLNRATGLLADLIVYDSVESLITAHNFSSAKKLCRNSLKSRPDSKFLQISVGCTCFLLLLEVKHCSLMTRSVSRSWLNFLQKC